MLALILMLVLGSGLVYISRFNYGDVSVNLGFYTFNGVPLFYVIVISLVIGLLLSYVIHMIGEISNTFRFRGKDREIKKNKEEVLELAKRVHQLELEKEKIKNGAVVEATDPNSLWRHYSPNSGEFYTCPKACSSL